MEAFTNLPPHLEAVSSSTKYDFWLASVQLTSTKIGEANACMLGLVQSMQISVLTALSPNHDLQACFPVFSVIPRLRQEDARTSSKILLRFLQMC